MIKESKILFFVIIFFVSNIIWGLQFSALILGVCYLVNLVYSTGKSIAFREYILAIYAVNYLLSPAIIYNYNDEDFLTFKMNYPIDSYFTNAISGIFALHMGVFFIKTTIFNTNFSLIRIQTHLNEKILRIWVFAGLFFTLMSIIFTLPSEITFFILLLSNLKYVGLFGLIAIDFYKHKYIVWIVALYEFYWAISFGFFHDLLIWIIFLCLFLFYVMKTSIVKKAVLAVVVLSMGYLIQNIKQDYRKRVWIVEGVKENAFSTFTDVADNKINSDDLFSTETMVQTLVRINQGWIAASTFDNMDRMQKFADFELLGKYAEAALLPRFLAPDKLDAGDRSIFNEYSGHEVLAGTSMGLGIIADGYVSFGFWGIPFFCFGLGLLFCIIFKIVESWGEISPIFVLMLFPILNFAVRPDCESQTILGYIVKGTFVFWLLMKLYKNYFEIETKELQNVKLFLDNNAFDEETNLNATKV